MCRTGFLPGGEPISISRIGQPFETPHFSFQCRVRKVRSIVFILMYYLDGFLCLYCSYYGCTDWSCSDTSLRCLRPHDIGTTRSKHNDAEFFTGKSTFVATHSRRINPDCARQIFYTAVNPCFVCAQCHAVKLITGQTTVEATNHHINRTIESKPYLREKIAYYRSNSNLRVYLHCARGGNFGLKPMLQSIFFAEQYGTCEVCDFNPVKITNINITDSKKGEVFYNFISKRTGTGNQDSGIFHPVFSEPGKKRKNAFTPFVFMYTCHIKAQHLFLLRGTYGQRRRLCKHYNRRQYN